MQQYRTRDNETLDLICYNYYGTSQSYVENTLVANLGLADYGPILPGGVIINMPDITEVDTTNTTINIWD